MSREESLQKELSQLVSLNSMADQLLDTIKKTQNNIFTSKRATDSTSALLEDWIKILNQTKFVNDALDDPSWTGPNDAEVAETNNSQEVSLTAELRALEKENESLQLRLDSLGLLPRAKRSRR